MSNLGFRLFLKSGKSKNIDMLKTKYRFIEFVTGLQNGQILAKNYEENYSHRHSY